MLDEEQIVAIAHEVMGDYSLFGDGWTFGMEDSLPTTVGGQNLLGHCHWEQKRIRLSREFAFSYSPHQIRGTMQHEVAHALTPSDRRHGEAFQAKLREIRSGA